VYDTSNSAVLRGVVKEVLGSEDGSALEEGSSEDETSGVERDS